MSAVDCPQSAAKTKDKAFATVDGQWTTDEENYDYQYSNCHFLNPVHLLLLVQG